MGLTPDLKPIVEAMNNMASAVEHLATAIDEAMANDQKRGT